MTYASFPDIFVRVLSRSFWICFTVRRYEYQDYVGIRSKYTHGIIVYITACNLTTGHNLLIQWFWFPQALQIEGAIKVCALLTMYEQRNGTCQKTIHLWLDRAFLSECKKCLVMQHEPLTCIMCPRASTCWPSYKRGQLTGECEMVKANLPQNKGKKKKTKQWNDTSDLSGELI